jgi:hypothetical protein
MLLVDSLEQSVGTVVDLSQGTIVRRVGTDLLTMPAPRNGFTSSAITFYHTSSDCSGPRYLVDSSNGAGFAYAAQVHETTLLFTRTRATIAVGSRETLGATQDPGAMGICARYSAMLSVGPAVALTDTELGNLVPPFHIK